MLPVLWLPSARDDLRQIVAYIAKENPAAARRMKIRIETSVLPLINYSRRQNHLRVVFSCPNKKQ
ncbi:putative plasmid stabilization-like protein from prophage [Shigella sonnei]|nr:putative plasmid stabilization-like protein from prophage [Shigella sonnei]